MSIILAIETSAEVCSVSLASPSDILLEQQNTQSQSSTYVLPLVQTLLDKANITLRDVSAIAFGAGPGSFTGIRNACALAQGLALGTGLPLIAVDSLMACAERARQETGCEKILVAIDARMKEIYWAEYCYQDSHWQILTPPSLGGVNEVCPTQLDYCVVGNALTVFSDAVFYKSATYRLSSAMPRADYIAQLALYYSSCGQITQPEQAMPIYVRNKVALTLQERALSIVNDE